MSFCDMRIFVLAMRLRTRVLPAPRKRKEKPSQKNAKKSQAKKSVAKKAPPLKEGRRSAEKRTNQEPHRRMRRTPSPVFPLREDRGPRLHQDFIEPWTSKNGAGALAFRRPTAASEILLSARPGPRFLEPPDANGRTLSGTSAASTSRSGTRRTGRCPSRPRAQCIATPTRTAPAPP